MSNPGPLVVVGHYPPVLNERASVELDEVIQSLNHIGAGKQNTFFKLFIASVTAPHTGLACLLQPGAELDFFLFFTRDGRGVADVFSRGRIQIKKTL